MFYNSYNIESCVFDVLKHNIHKEVRCFFSEKRNSRPPGLLPLRDIDAKPEFHISVFIFFPNPGISILGLIGTYIINPVQLALVVVLQCQTQLQKEYKKLNLPDYITNISEEMKIPNNSSSTLALMEKKY